jgi:mRNA interferase RelE/StbE
MADHTITFARSARKELENLSAAAADRILHKIETLAVNPHQPGTIKFQRNKNLWRLRVGDYRVVYSINDFPRSVDVVVIRHRRDVYQDL